ncbi:MAG: hypothetical protein WC356_06855 [Candidatus Micrarchaeia archaeon]|jgi:hypothetical protein
MELDRKTKWIIIILIAVLAIAITYYIDSNSYEKKMNNYFDNLKESTEVALIMDTRNSNSLEVNHKIMTCGIGIASGNVLVGKEITIYGIDNTKCIISYQNNTHDINATIEKCEDEMKNKIQIYIRSGSADKTIFEPNKMYLDISESFNGTCALQFQ